MFCQTSQIEIGIIDPGQIGMNRRSFSLAGRKTMKIKECYFCLLLP
jgi:hypothetical protein